MAMAEAGYLPPPTPMDILYLQRKFGGLFLPCGRLPVAQILRRHVTAYPTKRWYCRAQALLQPSGIDDPSLAPGLNRLVAGEQI